LGAQDLAGFRSDRRAGAARRLNPGYPAGLNKRRLWGDLADTLVARSIENLALVVSTHSTVEPRDRGLAFVAAPEELL
jgi:hypothetical protein